MQEFLRVSRKTHKWIGVVLSLPLFVIFATGILLSVSSRVNWLQPKPQALSTEKTEGVTLPMDKILEIVRGVPEAEVQSWDDVHQIDMRPKQGLLRVRSKNYWEVQLDGHSGKILSSAKRWKTYFIQMHEGTLFSEGIKTWIFIPTGLSALLLLLSGLILWALPLFKIRGKK